MVNIKVLDQLCQQLPIFFVEKTTQVKPDFLFNMANDEIEKERRKSCSFKYKWLFFKFTEFENWAEKRNAENQIK